LITEDGLVSRPHELRKTNKISDLAKVFIKLEGMGPPGGEKSVHADDGRGFTDAN
jgi:hypothetical protein